MTKAAELAKMGEVLTNSQIGGRRNMVINGAMQVAQRGNQNTSNATNTFGVDRFSVYLRGGAAATVSKDTDVPSGQGFSSSCKIDITTGDALGTSNDLAVFRQTFEGQDLQQLKKGTSSAEKVTVSFWIKSTITGTYILELNDNDNTRGISKSYTVNSSNTWEHKTITFEGDTTGAFDNDNNLSMYLMWALGAGSDFQGVTLATSWASISDGDARYEGQVNAVNSASNNIYFTGIQMEVGEQATPFEHRSFGEELLLCQRYYHKSMDGSPADNIPNTDNTSSNGTFGIAMYSSTSGRTQYFQHPVQMRADPSVTVYSSERANTSGKFGLFNHSAWVATATSNPTVDINRITFSITHGSSLTAGYSYLLAGGFDADAEL